MFGCEAISACADPAGANSPYASSTITNERGSASASADDLRQRLGVPGRVVGRAHEDDVRATRRPPRRPALRRARSLWAAREPGQVRAGEPRQPAVQQIRRLERRPSADRARRRPGAAAVSDLVGPVRGPDPLDRVTRRGCQRLAEPAQVCPSGYRCSGRSRIASANSSKNASRQRVRALVRVEADADVGLRRGVGLHVSQTRAWLGGRRHAPPASSARASIAFAWPTSPSARAIAEVPGVKRRAASGDISHHRAHGDVIGRAEPAREPGGAGGRQHVVRRDPVVAEGHRGPRTEEHRAGVADARQQGVGIGHEQQHVLGGEIVDDVHRLLEVADEQQLRSV